MPDHGDRAARSTYLREFFERANRDAEAQRDALAAVREVNARLASGRIVWAWPTIAAALTTRHHWMHILCDSCSLTLDLDLRMKPRHPESSVRAALHEAKCPRGNGHGRTRIIALDHRSSN